MSQNIQSHDGKCPGERPTTLRITRGKYLADILRAYKIVVDGEVVDRIKSNEIIEVPITPGQHQVVLRIDWCRSNELDVEIEEGETLSLECGSPMTGWRILLSLIYLSILLDRYLWLRKSS